MPSAIEKLHQTVEALRAENHELSTIKQAIDEHAILAITNPDGTITYANDLFCKLSEYSAEELIGSDHRIINSGFHGKKFMKGLWQTIQSGKGWHGNIKNKTKSGRYYWVKTTIYPVVSQKGAITRYISIRTDLTAMVEASESLAQANQELKHLSAQLEIEKAALDRKNLALSEVINNIEEQKRTVSRNIIRNIDTQVLPLIDQIRVSAPADLHGALEVLRMTLEDVVNPLGKTLDDLTSKLTPKEIQICNLIRRGLSVKEIAALMGRSNRTIEKHRENIRHKFGLHQRGGNLTTFLAGISLPHSQKMSDKPAKQPATKKKGKENSKKALPTRSRA